MPILIIRTVAGGLGRYADGDPVSAVPDDHVFGRMESLDAWKADGKLEINWPGGFALIKLPDITMDEARELCSSHSASDIKRKYTFDFREAERRSPETGRDTLNTQSQITRNYAEIKSLFSARL